MKQGRGTHAPAAAVNCTTGMRTILCWAGIAALAALGWSADNTTPAKKTTAPQEDRDEAARIGGKEESGPFEGRRREGGDGPQNHSLAPGPFENRRLESGDGSRTTAAHPGATKAGSRTTAARRGKKGPPAKRVTWRNRQLAPTPQRYKEIQDALAAKGYLKPEDANGTWNQASMDALKKFQAGQNLDSTGKINSLSLIALGLGPRRETAAPKPPTESPPAPSSGRQ